jgi:hypothetical protein
MSRDRQKDEIPAEKLALYEKLIRERPHIARKGAGLPYTSVNGHMFTFLSASGSLALRLPLDKREEFMEKYGASLFVAHGSVLKEYVEVPEKVFANTVELLPYLDVSYAYAQGLKPKKQKKPGGTRTKSTRR